METDDIESCFLEIKDGHYLNTCKVEDGLLRKRASAQAHPLHDRLTLLATKKDLIRFPSSSLFKFVLLSLVQVSFNRGVCLSMAERSDATCIKTSTRYGARKNTIC